MAIVRRTAPAWIVLAVAVVLGAGIGLSMSSQAVAHNSWKSSKHSRRGGLPSLEERIEALEDFNEELIPSLLALEQRVFALENPGGGGDDGGDGGDDGGSGCAPNEDVCGGTCTNLNTDPNNCGGCGNACPSGQACVFGACQP